MRTIVAMIAMFLLHLSFGPTVAEEARLLRFADIHEDRIAFVHAGDLWTVSTAGGEARRLTSHEGRELFPKFSPDGRWIAFSAEYSGSRQVHVIPADGGRPRQLTFYNDVGAMPPRGGFDHQVLDWTPDGTQVLFRANRLPWGVRMGRPYVVPVAGGMERPLAIPESGGGMYSPDGKSLVYTPISREFRTWKRHRGGRAQDVWIYDLENDRSEQVTTSDATENQPLWVGDTIYFTSDRDGRLNLHAWDRSTRTERKVTRHEDFDVLWPSAGPRAIVYECGGYLYRYDPATDSSQKVSVTIRGDFLHTLPRFAGLADSIGSMDISPSAARAVVGARGEIFTLPASDGEPRNLTRSPGVREMSPSWSPDGRWIAYLGDRTGEYEIYLRAQDGSGDERQLTRGGTTWKYDPVWSPDGEHLVFADANRRLHLVRVDDGSTVEIDRGTHGNIDTYRWSADGRWLVYDKTGEVGIVSIYLYSLDDRKSTRLGDGMTSDYDAAFDPEGRYLYFLSDRDYNLTFSGYEFNYFYTDPTRVYAAALRDDVKPLFAAKSDEEKPKADDDADAGESDDEATDKKKGSKKKAGKDKKSPEKAPPLRIDIEGFASRVVALPTPPGNYGGLTGTKSGVAFLSAADDGPPELVQFDIESEKVQTVLAGVRNYAVSADGKSVLFRSSSGVGIAKLAPDQKAGEGMLDTAAISARLDPVAEWQQIFRDGWRITRDFFYDDGMHGIDWQAMRTLYEPMVDALRSRDDLDYILGEMGGELNAGHFYVNSGDMPTVERVGTGLLGAEVEGHDSGFFRVTKILPGENWHDAFRSPLTEPGVNVSEGDFILAVNGRSATEVDNLYELLQNTAGRTVTLRVNDRPVADGARDERVRTVPRETNLRYLEWVNRRREMVDELSGGRIGYMHLPNTAFEGNRELRKNFYPQSNRDALILDVRYNGGGFIPDRMLELVGRKPLSSWARRDVAPMNTPGYAHDGPKACLINGYSSSGGDAFPYYFRKLGLGKLIGTRTWGGLIGLSGNPGFSDGGSLAVPVFRFYDTDGNWAVENEGVSPDIEVVDRPEAVAAGKDPTLEKAVELLLEELAASPPHRPEVPTPPRMRR